MAQTTIIPIRLRLSNAFLVLGGRPVLVDAGSPQEESKILATLQRHQVPPRDVALIALTHAHADHAGSALALREATGAPVAVHSADADMLSSGKVGRLKPVRTRHHLLKAIINHTFAGLVADLELVEGLRLDEFGLPARIVCTPGHTPGSVSIIADHGEAFVGDVLIGGFLGGLLDPHRPRLPYFAEDLDELKGSVQRLLGETAHRFYLGHGGPVELERVGGELAVGGWQLAVSGEESA